MQDEEAKGKDGYTSVASRVLAKSIVEEEDIAWGGPTEVCQVEEIQLHSATDDDDDFNISLPPTSLLTKDDDPSAWRAAIQAVKRKEEAGVNYSGGSKEGCTGAG